MRASDARRARTTIAAMEPATTITQAFVRTAAERPDEVAYRTRGDEISITWAEARERVADLASRLAQLGLGRGDTVALMLANRPEFHICDLAVLMTGATPFSVYQTSPPNQIRFIIGDAGSRVMITEQSFLPRILEARKELPDLETVIVIDGDAPDGVLALYDLPATDPGFDLDAAAAAVDAEDLLTLIYTSGTTGPPKGVEISHRGFFAYSAGLLDNVPNLKPGSHVISWLPNAHVAERNAHHYLPIMCQMTVTCCSDGREIMDYLAEVRPSWFFSVPRIWEKLQTRAEALLAEAPMYAPASLADAIEKVRLEQRGEPVPTQLASRVAEADERTFFSIRRALGLDRANCHIGAAPAAPELIEFFLGLGVGLSEIYGMSETTGAGTMNPPDAPRIGSSGKAVRNLELKLADDGEILVRGPIMMRRYRNLPDETAAAYTEDGWLHTGDIGEIDEDGYVRIVDRKKELIINAAGKNMSPANIEARAQEREPADRPGVRDRRRPALQHGADRARRRVRAACAERAGLGDRSIPSSPGTSASRRGRRTASTAPTRSCRGSSRSSGSRSSGRLAARRRRADADDEAQAQADRDQVRERRSTRCTP